MIHQNDIVYIAEDHQLVAQGIASLLQEIGFMHIEIFNNGKELYKSCLSKIPQLVFLDIYMTEWDGLMILENLRRNNFSMPIVMISMIAERKIIEQCMNLHANAYLHKSSDADEIRKALVNIQKDEFYVSEKLLKPKEAKELERTQSNFQFKEALTEREKEVLELLCDGLSIQEIADKLILSPQTIETHKKKLLYKFDVRNVAKMIAISYKYKIIQLK